MASNAEMRHACILIFANKSDLPHALSANELEKEMRLGLLGKRLWHIQESCATSGEGLWPGLQWLAEHVKDL
mgnify:FL=1